MPTGSQRSHISKPERKKKTKTDTETTQKTEGKKLTEQQHGIREGGLEIPVRELEESLESNLFLKKEEDDPNDADGAIPERLDDEEKFDEKAEYGADLEEDGDPSETYTGDESFLDLMPQSSESPGGRISIATRGGIYDLIIEECGNGDFYAYTPGSSIIRKFKFNEAFKSKVKTKGREIIYRKALEERLIHLQHIGDFLIRQIKARKDFFKKDSVEDALSLLEDFTPAKIRSDSTVGIHKSTITRIRNATICLPKFGEVSLDKIFNITKRAHHYRILNVIRNEDRNKPFNQEEIAEKAGLTMTRKMVGNILKELCIPTRSSKRKEAYRSGTAGWIK